MSIQVKAAFLLGVLALWLSPAVHGAARYASPAGLWDVFGTATVVGVFPDRKSRKASNVRVYRFLQFRDDGGYTTVPWLSIPGRWQSLKPAGKYRVSFDPAAVSNLHLPPFLVPMVDRFTGLAEKKYGTAPTITRIEVTAFSDQGRLVRKGLALTGTNQIKALVSYADPATGETVTARVRMKLAYSGLRASAPSACCSSDDAARNAADSAAFLAENATLPNVRTTASGLQYEVLRTGSGEKPSASSRVSVYYRGIYPDGQQFDSNFGRSSPSSFALGGVIPGFAEGLQLMQKGAYYRLYVPPELGYGEAGNPPAIKPNSALIFDVDLVDFQ